MFLHDIIEDLDLKTLLALSAGKDRNYTKLKEDAWHGEGDAWHGTGNEPRDAWHGTDGAVEEAQTKERNYNNGDRVKLTSEYADHRNPNEVFTVSQCDQERRRCWIGDKQGRGWYAEFRQIMPARSRSVEEGFDFDKLTSQQKAHEYNIDAAQRDMDRRHSQGEDMTGARIDKKTYEIIKPKKQFNEIFADQGVEEGKDPTTDSYQDARGNHRGQVKKNKDGSYYVATNQAGSSKGFTSEKAAKAHANSGEQEEAEQIDEIFADQGSGSTAKDSAAWEKRRNAVEKMLAKKKHAAAIRTKPAGIQRLPGGQLKSQIAQIKDKGVTEAEGDADGLPHLTKELLQHIIQQVGLEGAHAIVKSLEWGDGAAEELLALILKDLKDNISDEEIAEHIGKVKDGYRLYSHKGKNLGTFDTRAGAEKHEREVQYFKHASESLDEDFSDSPVAGAITRRILSQRLDLLKQYGPELVGAAVDHVADFVGEVEEIGTSDVSAWVNQVERMLEENPPQAFAEASVDQDEYSVEAGMSYGSLYTISRAADGLLDTIKEGDNLPEWCQEKISLAEDYLITVWDYLQSEKAQGVAESEKKGLYYNVNKRKAAGTSRDADSPKAPTAQAWKDAAKTAKKEGVAEGAALPLNVIELIKKIAQSSATPEHKKAMIDALVAKHSKQGVEEGEQSHRADYTGDWKVIAKSGMIPHERREVVGTYKTKDEAKRIANNNQRRAYRADVMVFYYVKPATGPATGVAEDEQSHGDKLRATPTERLMAFWNKYKDEPGISPVFGQQLKAIANELARRKQKMQLLSLHRDNYINRNNDINEATSNEAVTNAIINRIIGSHVSLLGKYGPEAVTSAAEDVAYHVGEVEEIGSSDVSAWVREVFNQLRDNHG